MPFHLVDANGVTYTLPATVQPEQLHVGGSPRIRFVRGYGSGDWFVVLDGIREPEALNLVGLLHTDRDETGIQTLLDALEDAAAAAVRLVHVDHDGNAVKHLPLLGALPITTSPDGVDGTLLEVTLPLVPGAHDWSAGAGSGGGSGSA